MTAKALGLANKFDKPVLQFLQCDEIAGGRQAAHDSAGPVAYADSLPFTVRYDGSSVVARINDQELRMTSAAQNPVVRIIYSTGEFLYTDLKIKKLN